MASAFSAGQLELRIAILALPRLISLTAVFDGTSENGGIRVPSSGDGVTQVAELDGKGCVQSAPSEWPIKYVYFDLDESFAFDIDPQPVTIVIEHYDGGCAGFELHYDSYDPESSVRAGAFKAGGSVEIGNTNEWKKATFELTDARFANRCNWVDFRLAVGGPGELPISRATVTKTQ